MLVVSPDCSLLLLVHIKGSLHCKFTAKKGRYFSNRRAEPKDNMHYINICMNLVVGLT